MLSEYTLRGLRWLIQGGQILRISTFAWDTPTKSVYVTKSKRTWCVVVTITAFLLMQFAFEVAQLYRLADDPSEPLENYIKLAIQCSTRLISTGIIIDSCFHGERMACILNQNLLLSKRIRDVGNGRRLKDTLKKISRVFLWFAFGYPLIVVASFLDGQHQSRYWHHLVFTKSIFPFTIPFFCVIEYLITSQNMHVCVVYLFICNNYFKTANAYMRLIVAMKKSPGSEWKNDSLSLYRTMQVYNQSFNKSTGVVWTYSMAGMFDVQVSCIVGAVRLSTNVPFPAYLMFPLGAIGTGYVTINMYSAASVATGVSQELAQNYFRSTDKYYRRVGASMKALFVEGAPFFVMTSTTPFSFTSEVVDKSISILLCT